MKVLIIAFLDFYIKILYKYFCRWLATAQMWRELECTGAESCESRLHSLLAVLQSHCAYLERQ